MKKIVLAGKGKRMIARLIDLSIVFVLSFFTFILFVFPNSLDKETYNSNNAEIIELYEDSGLYAVSSEGDIKVNCGFNNIVRLDDLYSMNVIFKDKHYESLSLTTSLYDFYTTKYVSYGGIKNLTHEGYCTNILQIGSEESNIKSYDVNTHKFELINTSREGEITTIKHFISQYETACYIIKNESKIANLELENQKIMLNAILLILPVVFLYSLVFDFIIPIVSKESETIGKKIMGLAVLSKDGYHYKKTNHIIRFLVYILIEVILAVLTLGGTFLITYTMFLFKKHRRCLHDILAKSIVIDKKESIFFNNEKEEKFFEDRAKRKGQIYG